MQPIAAWFVVRGIVWTSCDDDGLDPGVRRGDGVRRGVKVCKNVYSDSLVRERSLWRGFRSLTVAALKEGGRLSALTTLRVEKGRRSRL